MKQGGPLWIQGVVVGATAGVLTQVLVLRLNPELSSTAVQLLVGALLWASWGALCVGLPLGGVLVLASRLVSRQDGEGWWPAPEITAVVYGLAAMGSWVNADLHAQFLSGSGHRTVGQDAVTWTIGATLALGGAAGVRRLGRPMLLRAALVCVLLALPLVRVLSQPSPRRGTLDLEARPLGHPGRPLLVVGLEGLDSKVVLTHASGGQYPFFDRLASECAWGPLTPHRPFLRQSLWTSTATGVSPRRHGVMSRWTWRLPWLFEPPIRLLPWFPGGSRGLLPWGLAEPQLTLPASVPPLWERLGVSGARSVVIGWPGVWREGAGGVAAVPLSAAAVLEPAFLESLEAALAPFPQQRAEIWAVLESDLGRVRVARTALAAGSESVWLHLRSLAAVRRNLEPLRALDTGEREVLDLTLEFLDSELGSLLESCRGDTLVAVLSPYGLQPPDAGERLLRLVGLGDEWRTNAGSCPDGLLVLCGDGVSSSRRFAGATLVEAVPTVCYLLGLPVAQYMEGRVILDAVDADYIAGHPLRVVD